MRPFLIVGIALCVCAAPLVSHAAANAGVVTGIWFSADSFVEQTSVDIFAAVQNESPETIGGSVQFFVDGSAVGTTTFSALPAKVVRISLPYTFTPGAHNVSGRISSTIGGVSLLYEELPARSITVAALPPPPTSPPPTSGGGSGGGALGNIATVVTQAGNSMTATVNPIAESLAQTLERARDALAGRSNSSGTNQKNAAVTSKGKMATTAKKTTNNLFDVSVEIAQAQNVPLWRRIIAISLGIFAWLVRYWLWVIVAILVVIVWRKVRRHRAY